jgi:hypothetical protein
MKDQAQHLKAKAKAKAKAKHCQLSCCYNLQRPTQTHA